MSRDKQIDEMAKAIEQARIKAQDTTNSMNYGFGGWYAKELYNAGYRKADEVAREIFEEIEKIVAEEIHRCDSMREKEKDASERIYWEGGRHSLQKVRYWLAELKKKYMEDSNNG